MRVRLSETGKIKTGNTPKTSDQNNYSSNDIPFVKPSDISESDISLIDSTEFWISEYAREKARILPSNSVLVTCIGIIGKVAITERECAFNQQINAIIPNENHLPEYLAYAILAKQSYLQEIANAPVVPIINKSQFGDIEIQDAELHNQRIVVEKLSTISRLIELRNAQIKKLDELIKSRFVEMFGNFVYEKDKWSKCLVGDVAGTVDPQPSHRTPPVEKNGIPYIGIAECDYQTRTINFDTARKVGKNVLEEHISRYDLHRGDFIIGKIGTIGKPFFIPEERKYALSANTVLIQPNMLKVAPNYLFSVFQSEYMDRIIDAEKKSTSQPAFGIQKVRAIEIPLPPLDLQNQFADFVTQVEKQKATVQQSIDKLETLKKSLMQEYFG